jgi:hypothetical protein
MARTSTDIPKMSDEVFQPYHLPVTKKGVARREASHYSRRRKTKKKGALYSRSLLKRWWPEDTIGVKTKCQIQFMRSDRAR